MTIPLPKGWKRVKVADVADVRFSSVDKKVHAGQKPVRLCNYMDVWKNPTIHAELNFMDSTASDKDIENFGLQQGDVLLTKDSETREEIAEPAVVAETIDNLVLGYHLALLRPRREFVHGPFLAAQLRIPQFRAQFVRAASGATRYGLSMAAVQNAEVWLPPLPEQRRIAEILTGVDDAIDATRAVIDQTRKLKAALLQDLLSNGLPGRHTKFKTVKHLGRIPAEWEVVRIGEVFDVQLGKMLSKAAKTGQNYRAYLGNWNVRWGTFDLGRVEQMDFDEQEVQKFGLRNGDILVCEGGEVGRTAIWQGQISSCCYQKALHRLRPVKDKTCLPTYFMYFMLHATSSNFFERFTGQTSIGHLTRETLVALSFPLPTMPEQEAIVKTLEGIDQRIAGETSKLSQLALAKTVVSCELLSGAAIEGNQ